MARQPEHLAEQQRALGRYLAALREAAGLYQADLARAVPCHRTTVTHAEAGSQLPSGDFWETADRVVGANGALIARYDELIHAKAAHLAEQQAQRRARAHATAHQLAGPRGGMSPVVQTVTAITLGVGQADLDLDRLDRLIPSPDADEPPRQVGAADVDAIEDTSDALRRCNFARGGGLARAAASALLRSVVRLRPAAMTTEVRVRLDIASADLAMIAAWCRYDVEQHDQARRLWTVALELCRYTDHPRAADLAVGVLLDMAHQSLHLSRPDEALRLAGLGLAVENDSPGAVSDATRSYLASVQSWSYAALGETTACERAVGRAERHFAAADPGTAPPWAAFVTTAELTAQQGHAWYLLSATQPDAATRAVPLLTAATSSYGSDYAVRRAVNLAGLAGSHARAGDIDTAVSVGRHALEEICQGWSQRAYQRLRMLDDCLAVHQSADVADLRHDIQTACATS
ncbi:MAG: helix-turn-helix domain-containing protein [Pseudonocardiaceae bacterium]